MEQLKILEMIDRWRYLNKFQISDLLDKHVLEVETLLRDLVSKKLIRVDQLTKKIFICCQVLVIAN